MKTEIIPSASFDAIPRAIEILKAGGLVAFPTDTVYGVGALAFDGKAVASIYAAKDRPVEKAIPVLIGDADNLEKVGIDIPDSEWKAYCLPQVVHSLAFQLDSIQKQVVLRCPVQSRESFFHPRQRIVATGVTLAYSGNPMQVRSGMKQRLLRV